MLFHWSKLLYLILRMVQWGDWPVLFYRWADPVSDIDNKRWSHVGNPDSDLNPYCCFFVTMIKQYDTTVLFSVFYLKNWNCSSVTVMEQNPASIISAVEMRRVGLPLVPELSLAGRESGLIYMWEEQCMQPEECGFHRNEPCSRGTSQRTGVWGGGGEAALTPAA